MESGEGCCDEVAHVDIAYVRADCEEINNKRGDIALICGDIGCGDGRLVRGENEVGRVGCEEGGC